MKKLISTLVAAALVVPVAAQARDDRHDRDRAPAYHSDNGRHLGQYKQAARNWQRGERFDRRYATNYRVVDYRSYQRNLRVPPQGYQWVQSGNDAVLIGITSGIVSAVVSGLFR